MSTIPRKKRRRQLAAGAAAALGAAISPEAAAAVITVNSTADTAVVDGQCTLREAITNANANAATAADCAAGSGLDTINFSGLTFPATITLTSSLSIVDALIIDGPGQTNLTIDANDGSRIFEIEDADSATVMTVAIDDLTLTNGDAADAPIPGGGAIFTAENLTLTNVTISSSEADAGGAILVQGGLATPTLTIVDSTFTGNSAAYGGAILASYANLDISGSTFTLNTATTVVGAIGQSGGNFTLTNSFVTDNTAPITGGIALYYTDITTITNAVISGNRATVGDGGGLYIYGAQGSVTIEDSRISGNRAALNSGGVKITDGEATIDIRDTEISGNIAGGATGGLYLYDVDNVTLERVRLINNTAGAFNGGGAFWDAGVTIVESQISGNQAGSVGGLYVAYGSYLYLVNSTIANNTATTGSVGGLGMNASFAAVDVSTISGNSAPAGAAGNVFLYDAAFYMSNSIIANGTALAGPDLVTGEPPAVINYSLIENTASAAFTGANNLTGVDPQLGPLQNNGGPTETMKPGPTSPVVNAGAPEYATPPNDQRGFFRPVGIVDMGAVELNPGTLQFAQNGYNVNEAGGFVTITVTRTGGIDGEVGVNYTTSSGTATAGADFTTTSGTLLWADNESSPKSFNVPIANDLIFEGSETFNVSLNTPTGGATLGLTAIAITITDNDAAPTISISDGGTTEGNAGTTPATFTVSLSNPTTQIVTVDFATAGIDATSAVDFQPASGTLTFNPLVTSLQVPVNVIGDVLDELNETFTVTLSNPNLNATIFDGTGVGTITDDDAPPTISIGDVTQLELDAGNSAFTFNVTLSAPSSFPITVDFATAGGTATSGTDFLPNSGTLTFNPGVTSLPMTVQVVADVLDEANETFNVTLTNPTNATLFDGTGLGTITDDDGAPAINISDVTLAEGNGGTTSFTFNVTLAPSSGQTATVDFATAGLTATSGVDFQPASGTLTFNPGVTSMPVTVLVNGDLLDEPNETFTVALTNPTNAAIADNIGLGTITDDDASAINISDVTLAEGNAGTTNFVFTVTLTPASAQPVTVDFATQNGTAIAGSDYAATAGTLTFVPGDTSETITVPVLGDATLEPDETFTVVLSNAPLATISDTSGLGTITNDDAAPTADLNVTKNAVGDGPFVVGSNATFTITVTNAGPAAATNVHVLDALPAGTTFVSAVPTAGTCTGTITVDCNVGTLANGGSATVTLTVRLDAVGIVSNIATANSDVTDPTPGTGSDGFTVIAAADAAAIPTLSEWMLIALASALAAAAALKLKA